MQWNAGATSQEWYAYDLGGNRTLRRSTTGSGTTITVYAFGLEEHLYSSSGTPQSSTYYYTLGGRLLGELQGSTTQFFLTDALGSVLTTFNATAGSAAVQGNQLYGPYGNNRYSKGSMGTNKGFTGQYADATGLDYYNARYYDPVIGQFLSADVKQGNLQGMDPYGYVGGNPETPTDPSGEYFAQRDDNGVVQNTGRLSNTTIPDGTPNGQRAISVFTEHIGTGKTIRSTVRGIRAPQGSTCGCKRVTANLASPSPEKGQQKAKDLAANGAYKDFSNLSTTFGVIGGILGLLAIVAALVPFLGPIWAGILGGAAMGFGTLSYVAGELGGAFLNERENALSWFTTSNLEAQKGAMLGSIAGGSFAILGAAASVLTALAAFLGAKIPTVPIPTTSGDLGEPKLTPNLTDTGGIGETAFKNSVQRVGGIAFMITDALTYLGGAAILAYKVNMYTNQQEQLISGT